MKAAARSFHSVGAVSFPLSLLRKASAGKPSLPAKGRGRTQLKFAFKNSTVRDHARSDASLL
jgi:hypothetical protein